MFVLISVTEVISREKRRFLFLFRRSGGYKISALHVERLLLAHPEIKDIAIVGIDDPTWGQVLGAVIVPCSSIQDSISLDKVSSFKS